MVITGPGPRTESVTSVAAMTTQTSVTNQKRDCRKKSMPGGGRSRIRASAAGLPGNSDTSE